MNTEADEEIMSAADECSGEAIKLDVGLGMERAALLHRMESGGVSHPCRERE